MIILFPSYPFDVKRINPAFEAEERAAKAAGFKTALVDTELGSAEKLTFHRLPADANSDVVLYRGWLLKVEAYERLRNALFGGQGFRLITTLENYCTANRLPEWYEALGRHTPASLIFYPLMSAPTFHFPFTEIAQEVRDVFGTQSVLVKDFLKSRKHEWFDACFIHSAADAAEVLCVTKNFIDRQGNELVGGLVFREFVEFERAGIHLKSRMPLIKEWRFFVWQHKVIYAAPYWSNGATYDAEHGISQAWLNDMAHRVASPFFVLDVAKRLDGTPMVVEVNDGGSAGIPEGGSAEAFYTALKETINGH